MTEKETTIKEAPETDALADALNRDLNEVSPETEEISETQDTESPTTSETIESTLAPEIVQKAKSTGHLSPEEYKAKNGTLEGYKTEKEFVDFGEKVYPVLEKMNQKLEQRDREIAAMLKYQETTERRMYDKAKTELAQQLQQAKEYGDTAKVEMIAREQAKLDFSEAQTQQDNIERHRNSVAEQFKSRNQHWFNDAHPDLVAETLQIDEQIRQSCIAMNRPMTPEQIAQALETQMRINHPDIIGVVSKPVQMMSASRSAVNKTVATALPDHEKSFRSLSAEHKDIFEATRRILKKQGREYTTAKFIERLKRDGEI
jgi:hypothetical protein